MLNRKKVFISSVQSEFAMERKALADYLRHDILMSEFFECFIFEDVPATSQSPSQVYTHRVETSDIYLGLLGVDYGYEDSEGISPTEREYDIAKSENLHRWIFIKEADARHPKEKAFIRKVEQDISRKMFFDLESLKKALYNSCVLYLQQQGFIESNEFDNSLNRDADLNDLDTEIIRDFVVTARDKRNFPFKETDAPEHILVALNLMRQKHLVNSALLVFSSNPQKYFPSATIKCAHFHGVSIQKPIPDYKEFKGNVFNMADEAVDFILSKLSLSTGTRDKSNIVDTVYEVPRAIIAEAVINAIAHREYKSQASVQVAVFRNRIEISNPGGLPPELSIEDLQKPHCSYPRNPLLAECMFQYGAIERYGTGMLEIYNLSGESGLKSPEISLKEGFKVTLWRPSATDRDTDQDTDQVTDQVTDQDKKTLAVDPVHRLILVLNMEMSRKELMELLHLKHVPTFRENYIDPALHGSYIEMTIPEKPTSLNQKYRLTSKGLKLKKKLKK